MEVTCFLEQPSVTFESSHIHNILTMDWLGQFNQTPTTSLNQSSRKRKGEEVSVSEPSSLSASLGLISDFVVLENEKKKHVKVSVPQPKAEPIRVSGTRTIELRFSNNVTTYQGKIIAKEPWGTLCEVIEDCVNENSEKVSKGSRFWCKWENGKVNAYSIPVFEVMYPC